MPTKKDAEKLKAGLSQSAVEGIVMFFIGQHIKKSGSTGQIKSINGAIGTVYRTDANGARRIDTHEWPPGVFTAAEVWVTRLAAWEPHTPMCANAKQLELVLSET